ncbi:MAG: glycosyltransferase family 4 protein [Lachnospiraceae bacterium]|nr:glycosyltransferase family 4 protein [Lachnospiraceae bacterium]
MKIAILHSSDLDKISPGGVTQYVKQLIKFCDDGEITVFGTGDYKTVKKGERQEREYAGKKYYFIPVSTNKRRPLSIFYFLNEFRYLKALDEYDAIYSQRIEYTLPFLFKKSAREKLYQIVHGSIKYSITFYGNKIGWMLQKLERLSIKLARRTLVVLMRDEVGVPYYKRAYKKYADKVDYGKVPIDTRLFRSLDKEESRKILNIDVAEKVALYLGRLDDDPKRILLYPEIVKKVREELPDFRFFVIGTGEDSEKLRELIAQYELSDCMCMVGYVEAGEGLSRYLAAADCTINISKFEGTCTSTLESIACARPVITTDVGDVKKYMPEGKNGIIIPNDDAIVDNAARAIVELMRSPREMTDIYKAYDGPNVMKELKQMFEGK